MGGLCSKKLLRIVNHPPYCEEGRGAAGPPLLRAMLAAAEPLLNGDPFIVLARDSEIASS